MRSVIGRVIVLAAAALAPACTTVTRSATRVAPPSDPQGKKHGGSVTLSLDEHLHAELRTTDAVSTVVATPSDAPATAAPVPAAPPLGLALQFQTRVLGYSFDPGQLVLRDGRGGEWRPVAASAGRLKYGECQAEGVLGDARGGYVPLAHGSCVLVHFDRAVGAGDRLELVVAGAALGKRRLEPVTVGLFRVESTWRQANDGLVDALTLPLKILLLPFAMYGGG
jgi:hypothetical protein